MVNIEITPNPDTLKFLPGKKVSEVGPVEFLKNEKNIKIPLAKQIFSLDGIVMVFFGEDFITVKKEKSFDWEDLKHSIISEINDYYSKGNTVVVKKDFNNFVISFPIGQIFSIIDSLNLLLKVEKFLPPNSCKTLVTSVP